MDSSQGAQRGFLLPIIYCEGNIIIQEVPAWRDGRIYSWWLMEFGEETSSQSSVYFSSVIISLRF